MALRKGKDNGTVDVEQDKDWEALMGKIEVPPSPPAGIPEINNVPAGPPPTKKVSWLELARNAKDEGWAETVDDKVDGEVDDKTDDEVHEAAGERAVEDGPKEKLAAGKGRGGWRKKQ